jgi:hypothetical protein
MIVLKEETMEMGHCDRIHCYQFPHSSRYVLLGGKNAEIYEICIRLRVL